MAHGPKRVTSRWLPALAAVAVLTLSPALLVMAPSAVSAAPSEEVRAHHGGHAEAAEHGVSPAAEHGEDTELNWLSCDYKGPEAKHRHPPLLAAIVNFTVVLLVLFLALRRPVATFLQNRHNSVRKDLDEAAQLRQEAQARLQAIDARLRTLDQEVAALKEAVARDAEQEKRRIVAEAEQESGRIIAHAERTLQQEIERVKRRLEVNAITAAMEAAEKLLKQEVRDSDRQRLREEFLAQLNETPTGTIGGATGGTP